MNKFIICFFILFSCEKESKINYIIYRHEAKMFEILTPQGYVKIHSFDTGYEQLQFSDTSKNPLVKFTIVPFTGYKQSFLKEVKIFKNEFAKSIRLGEIDLLESHNYSYLNITKDSIFAFSEEVKKQEIIKYGFMIKSEDCSSFIFLIFDFKIDSKKNENKSVIRKILLSYKCNWGAPWTWYPERKQIQDSILIN